MLNSRTVTGPIPTMTVGVGTSGWSPTRHQSSRSSEVKLCSSKPVLRCQNDLFVKVLTISLVHEFRIDCEIELCILSKVHFRLNTNQRDSRIIHLLKKKII